MGRRITAATILIFTLASAQAEEAPERPRSILVMGEGEVAVEPDRMSLVFGIETSAPRIKDAQQENARRTQALLDALKKLKVPAKDIQTGLVRIEPRYHFDDGRRRLMDYSAQKSFTVTVTDLANYGAVITAVLDAGVESLGGLQFDSSRRKTLEAEARTKAVADARAKAETLASAAGGKVGRPLSIEERGWGEPVRPFGGMKMAAESLRAGAVADAVAPGEIVIRTSVSVRFELN